MDQEQGSSRSQPSGMGPQADHIGPRDQAPSAAIKPSEILSRAADLISGPGAWTQGAFARDAEGQPVSSGDSVAVCWCTAGAINLASSWTAGAAAAALVLTNTLSVPSVHEWNDEAERTQPEVVAAVRQAAELAHSEGN